jgi:hypothetical protein
MDKTRINQELKDLEQQQQAKLDELKRLFTNRFADYGIIEQSILGKVAISLLRFRPDPSLLASQPKFRPMLWHNTVWLVLIAPYEIGEHEAMLWLSPSLAEGEYYFQKAYDQCEEWQLSDGEYEENESQMDSEELEKEGQLFREEMEKNRQLESLLEPGELKKKRQLEREEAKEWREWLLYRKEQRQNNPGGWEPSFNEPFCYYITGCLGLQGEEPAFVKVANVITARGRMLSVLAPS